MVLSAGQVVEQWGCRLCCGFLLVTKPGSLLFTTTLHEAKAGRTGLVPGVVGLVTVGKTMDNILLCLILNQSLLYFLGFTANHTFDDVFTKSLMVTKAVAAVTLQWFGHPGAEIKSPPAAQGQLS